MKATDQISDNGSDLIMKGIVWHFGAIPNGFFKPKTEHFHETPIKKPIIPSQYDSILLVVH